MTRLFGLLVGLGGYLPLLLALALEETGAALTEVLVLAALGLAALLALLVVGRQLNPVPVVVEQVEPAAFPFGALLPYLALPHGQLTRLVLLLVLVSVRPEELLGLALPLQLLGWRPYRARWGGRTTTVLARGGFPHGTVPLRFLSAELSLIV